MPAFGLTRRTSQRIHRLMAKNASDDNFTMDTTINSKYECFKDAIVHEVLKCNIKTKVAGTVQSSIIRILVMILHAKIIELNEVQTDQFSLQFKQILKEFEVSQLKLCYKQYFVNDIRNKNCRTAFKHVLSELLYNFSDLSLKQQEVLIAIINKLTEDDEETIKDKIALFDNSKTDGVLSASEQDEESESSSSSQQRVNKRKQQEENTPKSPRDK